jgi:hypothetical protein
MTTETFQEDDNSANSHNLSYTAITDNECNVSFNGATLKPADYTLTLTTITVNFPVMKYDRIVITYTHI